MAVVRVDMSGVPTKLDALRANQQLGLYASTEAARLMQPYVPEREGILKDSPASEPRPFAVVYNTPYARAMYEGVVKGTRVRYTKPTAISHWERGIDTQAYARSLQGWIARSL